MKKILLSLPLIVLAACAVDDVGMPCGDTDTDAGMYDPPPGDETQMEMPPGPSVACVRMCEHSYICGWPEDNNCVANCDDLVQSYSGVCRDRYTDVVSCMSNLSCQELRELLLEGEYHCADEFDAFKADCD